MAGLGVAVIGSGFMGKCHALAWNAVASVFGDVERPRLEVLCDISQEHARARADAFGFARFTTDWRTLLDDPAVDVVSITSPNQFHAEMAIAALRAGKHVWCEKPMATRLSDAIAMRDAARESDRVAVLGYNYIQSPMVALMRDIIACGEIGTVNHVRVEMDEDFMADPEAPFALKNDAVSGHGALDDFAVHPFSLLSVLVAPVAAVLADQSRPFASRPAGEGRRALETYDIATVLLRLADGASGHVAVNRAAWGRKGRIFVQIFGTKGTLVYDQERLNEVQLFTREGEEARQGFRTILSAPCHPPYDRFIPAPGHGLGFNDLKVIECRALLGRINGEATRIIDFGEGLAIERIVAAAAESFRRGAWVPVEEVGDTDGGRLAAWDAEQDHF